jgi:antitoxin MazE
MEATLKKWGNSIGVRLPSSVLKEAYLTQNQRVTISTKKGAIVIKPLRGQQYSFPNSLTASQRIAMAQLNSVGLSAKNNCEASLCP